LVRPAPASVRDERPEDKRRPAAVEAAAAAQNVQVQRGDILRVRTGHVSRYLDRKDWRHFDMDDCPGVSA
jgi:putative cyclase